MKNTNNKQTDQVFISFRGKDQRNGFLSHLKQKLIDSKVNVFTDENATGEPHKNLFEHIRNSRIAIVIFSECYPESEWCWDELVEIQKCRETEKLKAVIPIFHNVEISTIKEQSEEFGDKFWALQISLLSKKGIGLSDIKDINWKIENWKKALIAVTETCGLIYKKDSSEAAFVQKVVEEVKLHLPIFSAEKERNSTPATFEVKQSNQIVYNINQFKVNNYQLHFSKSFQALDPEGYNVSVDLMEHFSGGLKRNNSDLDHRDQHGPFPFEAIMVQKQREKQRSIDNIPQKKDSCCTTFRLSLRYCIERCLCLNDSEQKMIQTNRGNQLFLTRN